MEKIALPTMNYDAITTICKNCTFAEKWGNHQTGCEFARIERFAMHGGVKQIKERWVKISELVDNGLILMEDVSLSEYNEDYGLARYNNGKFEGLVAQLTKTPEFELESTYYEIPRYCNKCRDSKWADAKVKQGKNLKLEAIEESKLKVTVLVKIREGKSIDDLKATLDSIKAQSYEAHEVIVLTGAKNLIKRLDAIDLLKSYDFPYYVYMAHFDNDCELALLDSYQKAKGKWIVECEAGHTVPADTLNNINEAISNRLERIILWYMTPNIKAFQKRTLVEYTFEGIEQKAKDENMEYLIKYDYSNND